MKLSLLKKERLQKSADYRRVYTKGRGVKTKKEAIWVCPNTLQYNRLGISTSKKKFKLSCTRNKIRRLIREVYRLNKGKLKKGFDIVIIPQQARGNYSYAELEEDMLKAYKKAGVLE